ncbi:MAG: hypothetical protein PVG65_01700, partial [Candidatus Thorarchaeota archaeon]
MTDFRVYALSELYSHVMWEPRVTHLRLESDMSVILKARYNPDLTFTGSASGIIRVRVYNETLDLPVT